MTDRPSWSWAASEEFCRWLRDHPVNEIELVKQNDEHGEKTTMAYCRHNVDTGHTVSVRAVPSYWLSDTVFHINLRNPPIIRLSIWMRQRLDAIDQWEMDNALKKDSKEDE